MSSAEAFARRYAARQERERGARQRQRAAERASARRRPAAAPPSRRAAPPAFWSRPLERDLPGLRRLAAAVLKRAADDFRLPEHRDQAWAFIQSEAFDDFCELAGIDGRLARRHLLEAR